MYECKNKMVEFVDVFVMVFGGVGLLEEFFEMYSWV